MGRAGWIGNGAGSKCEVRGGDGGSVYVTGITYDYYCITVIIIVSSTVIHLL